MYTLIAETPVAGTVPRIGKWIKLLTGLETFTLIERNYEHHAFNVPGGTFGCIPRRKEFVARSVANSRAVFIHNVFNKDLLNLIFDARPQTTPVIYQYHSPPFEAPAFSFEAITDFPYDAVLAVAQGYGRFFRNAITVPNIVPDTFYPVLPNRDNILFIPHLRTTKERWSNKVSTTDVNILKSFCNLYPTLGLRSIKDAFGRDRVSHDEIQFYLRTVRFVIDDINTGLFHQTAIEGVKAGCLVFSGADAVSVEEFCEAADCPPPPFLYVSGVQDVVRGLLERRSFEAIDNSGSNTFAEKYLSEERLAQRYLSRIKELV